MAHIQLISVAEPPDPKGIVSKFPYAYPVICAGLRETSHTFEVLDTHLDKIPYEEICEAVTHCTAKIFGISAWSHHYALVKDLTAAIRNHFGDEAVIIVGGVIAGNDDVLVECTDADIICTGAEGEIILPRILDALDQDWLGIEFVEGLTYRDRETGGVIKTAPHRLMNNTAYQAQPWPYYEYFDDAIHELVKHLNARTDIPVPAFPSINMRGCPFKCNFCGHLYERRSLRKEWNQFFDEMEYLINRYGVKGFYSFDTNLFISDKQVEEYCRIYEERGCTFTIIAEVRAAIGNLEIFRRLKDHGVLVITFGYESGSQEMLDNIKKEIILEDAYEVVKAAYESDMVIHGNFVFGTPGERQSTIRETRDYMVRLERLQWAQFKRFEKAGDLWTSGYNWGILLPSTTSELYKVAQDSGLLTDEEAYLMSMADPKYLARRAGSDFRLELTRGGGRINMSRFRSFDAMEAYVRYTVNAVQIIAIATTPDRLVRRFDQLIGETLSAARHYLSYVGYGIRDVAVGNRAPDLIYDQTETEQLLLRRQKKQEAEQKAGQAAQPELVAAE